MMMAEWTASPLTLVLTLVVALVTWLLLRTVHVALQIRNSRKGQCKSRKGLSLLSTSPSSSQQPTQTSITPLKTMVVLGSGGHTTEMLNMIQPLNPKYYHPLIFVKAKSDTTSVMRLEKAGYNPEQVDIFDIPRSREVGQSYWSSVVTTGIALCTCIRFLWRQRPDLILCNGPGTCLPIALVALVLGRIVGFFPHCSIIFVESFCRVQTLSLTGKIMYWMADLFVVHWDELHQKYPSSVLSCQFVSQQSQEEQEQQLQQQQYQQRQSQTENEQ
ncbi:hypothetical protein ACA910_015182 [Epithemia clementina (nom. ined.)]